MPHNIREKFLKCERNTIKTTLYKWWANYLPGASTRRFNKDENRKRTLGKTAVESAVEKLRAPFYGQWALNPIQTGGWGGAFEARANFEDV